MTLSKSNAYSDSDIKMGSTENFGHRLSYGIEKSGVSKAWLAEKLNISKQALNYLIKHAAKPKYVNELSEYLSLSPEWLEFGTGVMRVERVDLETNEIPVVDQITLMDYLNGKNTSFKNTTPIKGDPSKFIAYKLENDSLFPPFIEGSILIIERSTEYKHGDYVLLIDIEGNSFVRRVILEAGSEQYLPSNNAYMSFSKQDSKLKVVGVLKQALFNVS